MNTLRNHGRLYRVTGASGQTGEDVEITVEAYDESDAARAANRQGIFVSRCEAVGTDGSTWAAKRPAATDPSTPVAASATTFAETVARNPVVQRLLRTHPQLAPRLKRLNAEDRGFLCDLVGEEMGISYRDSVDVSNLMKQGGRVE